MSELQLFPGPRLVRKSWVYDREKGIGEWVSSDVTDRAFEYLFQELAVDSDVTLADVFGLVMDEPIMQAVFRQEFVAELCAEVRKGPVVKAGEPWEKIEFLELYQLWNHDTSTCTAWALCKSPIFLNMVISRTEEGIESSGAFPLPPCASCCTCRSA
jgi:hypothetical protein